MKKVSEKTREFFEGYAGQFDEIYMIQTQKGLKGWLNRRLRASMLLRYEQTFSALQPMENRSVLDVGCGSGRYLIKCLELGAANVTGIDLSEKMLLLSRRLLDSIDNSHDRAELVLGDFMKYHFKEPYDYAIVIGVMDYIKEAGTFLRKVRETVSQKAVLSFPASESVWASQRKVRYKLRGCPLYLYRRGRLEELMRCSGFKSFLIERMARDYFVVANG